MDISRQTSWTLLSLAREESSRESAASGGNSAWNEVVEIYAPVVFHWCREFGITQKTHQEDVTQDVFVTLWKSLPRLENRQRKGAFRKYVKMITQSRSVDYLRRSNKEPDAKLESKIHLIASSLDTASQEDPGAEDCDQTLVMDSLFEYLKKYSESNRDAFLYFERDDIPTKEIGEIQSRSDGAVRTGLSRMRKEIIEDIEAYRRNSRGESVQAISRAQNRNVQRVETAIEGIRSIVEKRFIDLV